MYWKGFVCYLSDVVLLLALAVKEITKQDILKYILEIRPTNVHPTDNAVCMLGPKSVGMKLTIPMPCA
jgi:hypothetical protein